MRKTVGIQSLQDRTWGFTLSTLTQYSAAVVTQSKQEEREKKKSQFEGLTGQTAMYSKL